MRRFKHLSRADRIKIETLFKAGHKPLEVAKIIGVHSSTIYRERKRGMYIHTLSDLTHEVRYSSDLAEKKYREHLKAKGAGLKIGNDLKLADFIERKIIENGYPPEAVLLEIKSKNLEFKTTISKTTLYSYVEKGIFFQLTNKHLPYKRNQHKKYKKIRIQKRSSRGTSIEKRPTEINSREEFGHWEMDTVIGKRNESTHSLLVLTERKTRNEILFLLQQHTAQEVVKIIDQLEENWGNLFSKVFKTITVDNGSEFADCTGIERSVRKNISIRLKLFYCHPYCSYERGSNENQNKLIRRKIPVYSGDIEPSARGFRATITDE